MADYEVPVWLTTLLMAAASLVTLFVAVIFGARRDEREKRNEIRQEEAHMLDGWKRAAEGYREFQKATEMRLTSERDIFSSQLSAAEQKAERQAQLAAVHEGSAKANQARHTGFLYAILVATYATRVLGSDLLVELPQPASVRAKADDDLEASIALAWELFAKRHGITVDAAKAYVDDPSSPAPPASLADGLMVMMQTEIVALDARLGLLKLTSNITDYQLALAVQRAVAEFPIFLASKAEHEGDYARLVREFVKKVQLHDLYPEQADRIASVLLDAVGVAAAALKEVARTN